MATAPRAVVEALQHERALATNRLRGTDEVIALEVTDTAEARRLTDVSVALFETFVADSPDGRAYADALATLEDLGQLRTDIDADPGPRDLDNLAASQAVFDRYAAMVDGLLDGQMAFAETDRRPGGARGRARPTDVGCSSSNRRHGSSRRASRLCWCPELRWSPTSTGSTPTCSRVWTRLVAATAGTPYAEAAATVVGEVDGSGLLDATAGVLDGGSLDLSVLFDARDLLLGESWPAYLDRVEEILASQG